MGNGNDLIKLTPHSFVNQCIYICIYNVEFVCKSEYILIADYSGCSFFVSISQVKYF